MYNYVAYNRFMNVVFLHLYAIAMGQIITSGLTQPSTWAHLALFSNLERQHRQKVTRSFIS